MCWRLRSSKSSRQQSQCLVRACSSQVLLDFYKVEGVNQLSQAISLGQVRFYHKQKQSRRNKSSKHRTEFSRELSLGLLILLCTSALL